MGALAAFAGASVVGRGERQATHPDRFEYHGHAVWWSDWREPLNQDVKVGFWSAIVLPDEYGRNILVSCTMGKFSRCRELEVFDTSRDWNGDWPILTRLSSPQECETVKQRALQQLLERLDA